MKVLEVFACAGGASRGLVAAGNEVIATDIDAGYLARNPVGIDPHGDAPDGGRNAPVRQPWEWVSENRNSRAEVLDWEIALEKYGDWADWIWASPPCQVYSATKGLKTGDYPDLVEPVRDALLDLGKPYVIENVPGSPLVKPVTLCGCMFYGLRVYRQRLFESSMPIIQPPHAPHRQRGGDMGRPARHGERVQIAGHNSNSDISRAAMGYDHKVDKVEMRVLSESIPPHFAHYVAREAERILSRP